MMGRHHDGPGGFATLAEEPRPTLVERTLLNLAGAWNDIAEGAARTLGLAPHDDPARSERALRSLMRECLEARGGEVSARMRAAELGQAYLRLEPEGKARFLSMLAHDFAVDGAAIEAGIEAYRAAPEEAERLKAESALRRALVPPRVKLLTQFNILPEGVKFLADLRADLLTLTNGDPQLNALDRDLRDLLESWFDVGFLDLRRITWNSPAALLERLIEFEAVHAITSWTDLRNRLESDRRLYALFHPRMPDEPLAFVEVALVKGMADNVQVLLDEEAPPIDTGAADSAIFYSITNTQRGLRGISFGDYLIKRVVQALAAELPNIKVFATLSPIPGFRAWLGQQPESTLAAPMTEDEQGGVRALGGSDDLPEALAVVLDRPDWPQDPVTVNALRGPLQRLCARYFLTTREGGTPIDPVSRFHLRNGARLERINWLGDSSAKGLAESAGLMVNYRYQIDDIEKNHEAYIKEGLIALGPEVRALTRQLRGRWLAA